MERLARIKRPEIDDRSWFEVTNLAATMRLQRARGASDDTVIQVHNERWSSVSVRRDLIFVRGPLPYGHEVVFRVPPEPLIALNRCRELGREKRQQQARNHELTHLLDYPNICFAIV